MGYKGRVDTTYRKPPKKWRGQEWEDFLPNHYADVTGWLEGVPLFIVATGTSMDQIPDVWNMLMGTSCATVGINHVLKMFSPTFWTAWDREYYGDKYKKVVQAYTGIPVWEWRFSACRHKHMKRLHGNTATFDFKEGDMEAVWAKRGIDSLIPAGQSDCYALEIFTGMMKASPVYLLGVDYFREDDRTQSQVIWDKMDHHRRHMSEHNGGRFKEKYRSRNLKCHRAAYNMAQEEGREIYTCVPDERSITHETFSYVPFEEALAKSEDIMAESGKSNVFVSLRKHMDEEGVDESWESFPVWSDKTFGKERTEAVKRFYGLKG